MSAYSFQSLINISPDVLNAFQPTAESDEIVLNPVLSPLLWPLRNIEMSASTHDVHLACCVMHVKQQDYFITSLHSIACDCHLCCVHAAAIQGSSDRGNNRYRKHACF